MNEIAFVVAPYEYGIGPGMGVEPVIDGVSVVDFFARADGEFAYAGLTPPKPALTHWHDVLAAGGNDRVNLLGCGCGDPVCSWATARVEVLQHTVVWSQFWGSSPPAGEPGPRLYDQIGPYQFDRSRYTAALETPMRSEAPVREKRDTAALRAGVPSDPRDWLKGNDARIWPGLPHTF